MNKSLKPTATETIGKAEAQDRPSSDAAICYRMEPAKQMLSHEGCHHAHPPDACNVMPPCLLSEQQHSVVNLENVSRVALMITPKETGDTIDQAWEAVSTIRAILKQQPQSMSVTSQTVFLRSAEDEEPCRKLFAAYFGSHTPATNFIVQPPCGGQALAIEAWALGGKDVDVQFPEPNVVTVTYDGLRWTQVSGVCPLNAATSSHAQGKQVFDEMAARLYRSGTSFDDVVRVWLYQGSIVDVEDGVERYRELNRARADFFERQEKLVRLASRREGETLYPASTGIGMQGRGLAGSCLALQTERTDLRLKPLENPLQVSAFDYAKRFSAKSPKFSRAMAVIIGDYVTSWISGTASIIDSESVHLGDIEKQTEQTIDNIERLVSAENFERHGLHGGGAELSDLAKVRVYVKRPEDYEKCRAICEQRFGNVPAIYAHADVCRSELLVEIEGVAFSTLHTSDES